MAAAAPVVLALALSFAAPAQQPAPQNPAQPATQPSAQPAQPAAPAQGQAATPPEAAGPEPAEPAPATPAPPVPASAPTPEPVQPAAAPAAAQAGAPSAGEAGAVTEEEIKQLLIGKDLYLRGGYLDDSLTFNEHGALIGHSPQGSYTLCGVEINKVRLTRHKLELEGARYGLHFLGALPYEDPTKAVDRVRITPKKKVLKITIDREVVVKPKKEKKEAKAKPAPAASSPKPNAGSAAQPPAAPQQAETTDAEEAKAEIAAAPPEERPADPGSVTTTTSPAHAAKVLKDALDAIFAPGLDERMMVTMPDFWKLYYEAAAAHTDFRPKDPTVMRQNTVDSKAKLLTTFEPSSNEFAQANGVAGMALYHAVIGVDGKPTQIAVARPIGFGLDENAVEAIRHAKFEPAMKDGKPVPVLLDLVVQFRIYSKRTAVTGAPDQAEKPAGPILPGPYSVEHSQQ